MEFYEYKDALDWRHVLAYSMGHLANDLYITIWEAYSVFYLSEIVMLSESHAGLTVLIG